MSDIPPNIKMHFQLLINAFAESDKFEKITIKKGSKFLITDNICCIQEGVFSIYMNQEDRLLTYAEGYAIFGLVNTYTPPTLRLYIKPTQTSTIYNLPAEEGLKIIREKNLYESVSHVQAYNMTKFFHMFEKTITPNNYAFIRTLLMDLNQNSDAVKASVTVASYIIKRSGLSRSYVMLVLSELRKGGYINMEDGKLTSITSLPERF
ncbi:helix-turn-helix domain-containing protein [Limnobaculum parvum]|uniref:IprA winged helix-turn-helix domain-containing protein n=1 Tax=Limnobaculum parvum TaxID=2172103 RepID=A0A2Y9TXI5_9GAMM|nr:helix-turn-helix domain-containing protein [Limnobaculum parvum]AWH88260.1 hypothetical protein HYN51_06615 [Limnobaculum parvum]